MSPTGYNATSQSRSISARTLPWICRALLQPAEEFVFLAFGKNEVVIGELPYFASACL